MICRLCLQRNFNYVEIFSEDGLKKDMANILAKHFWFQPMDDDPISTSICTNCWENVYNFHEFYLMVKKKHTLLTERYFVKSINVKDNVQEVGNSNSVTSSTLNLMAEHSEYLDNSELISCDVEIDSDTLEIVNHEHKEKSPEKSLQEIEYSTDSNLIHCSEDLNIVQSFEADEIQIQATDPYVSEEPKSVDTLQKTIIIDDHIERRLTRSTTKAIERNDDEQTTIEKQCEPVSETSYIEIPEIVENTKKKRRGRPRKTDLSNINNESPVKVSESSIDIKNDLKTDDVDLKIAEHMNLTCDVCAIKNLTFGTLRQHMRKVHRVKGYVLCCGKKFFKRSVLVEHIEKHVNPEQYKCNECDKVFKTKQCMRNHVLLKHTPDEEKTFKCDSCPKKFAKLYLLTLHRSIHSSQEEYTHVCEICKKCYPTASRLATHIKLTHSGYGTMCDICAKVIRGRSAFAKHQLQHTGAVIPKVQCDKCGSWHKDKYSLQKHKRRHNEDGTLHICDICNKVAPNRSALLSHQRYVHSSERKYKCGLCQKAFKKPLNLKEHMALHTGDTLYSCPHCTKTFNSNANMHSHRKKVHPKEFEETRKNRMEASKLSTPTEDTQVPRTTNSDSHSQIITIQTPDDGEIHNIIITTEDFSEDGMENEENSIILTLNT
ncbi:transcription factor grauzone-like [Teleopsis dalmanni]|uniref:transcription factor grauzone-like n=1 Tax=Teleopsis dalmanni TaxID=139649 RepID=UPI0018CFAE9B|nr:transcription factor grauzone-like [Teleopsis dalmanni]